MKKPFSPLVVEAGPIRVSATEFKTKCLAMMQSVHDGRTSEVVVTKHGKPLARIVAYARAPRTLLDFAKGKIEVRGDIFSTGERWDATLDS